MRGLVIGKFLPPHAGHHHVIERAVEDCQSVEVVLCDRPDQLPPADMRAGWLAEIHPTAAITVVPDICGWHGNDVCPPECSRMWSEYLGRLGKGPWDVVYGSDSYLIPFANELGAGAVSVDPARTRFPVSGTAVRADLSGHWTYLHPVVRAGLVRRVVVVGAESTGTTTLAADLAGVLGVPWVPEYGREYSAARAAEAGSLWEVEWKSSDFDHIAAGQEELEAKGIRSWVEDAERSRPGPLGALAICDTDVLATAIWHRRYCGEFSPRLLERALLRPPLLYVLTSPEGVPFEQDGLRDGEHLRAEMTDWFREALAAQPAPWIEVVGSREERRVAVFGELAS